MGRKHPTLIGRHALLVPLAHEHVPALWTVAQSIQDAATITLVPRSEAEVERYVTDALGAYARGVALPYAIVARGDRVQNQDRGVDLVVGTTRFANIERWQLPGREAAIDVVEIGWTLLCKSAQRTPINTDVKTLMLTHAFGALDVQRVTIKTDALNTRSRAAIERIGARFEGILRSHMPSATGGVRDTAMYSVVRADWPALREHLHSLRVHSGDAGPGE